MSFLETYYYLNVGAFGHGETTNDAKTDTEVVEEDPKFTRLRALSWILTSWGGVDTIPSVRRCRDTFWVNGDTLAGIGVG